MADPQPQQQVNLSMQLPEDMHVGVFADFANLWHTPNTFVIDFLATKMPPHPVAGPDGQPSPLPVLETRVAARVRIPSEQIFPLINALQQQGNAWLAETGRSEPPANWVGGSTE